MSSILPSHPLALADGMVSAYSLFILSLSFDETRECLTLPIHPTLALSVQQSAWHVLVSVATMILSLPPESIDDLIGKSFLFQLVRPTVPLLSTNASSLSDGLFSVPAVREFSQCEENGIALSNIPIIHFDTDGAFANGKCIENKFRQLPAGVFGSHKHCCLHANKLVELAVTLVFSLPLVAKYYSLSLLFRMGGYFLRLVQATPIVVADRLPRHRQVAKNAPSAKSLKNTTL